MQVNIKFVNFPRPGSSGKYGNIKTTDGQTIMVPAEMLDQFRAGMSCEIATKQQTWGGGDPVTIVTSGPLRGPTGPVQGYGAPTGYQGPVSRETLPRSNTGFQPRVIAGGAGQPVQRNDQGREIFVTGVVGRAMGSGKFAASEIPVLAQAANDAWDRLVNPRPAAAPPPDDPPPGMEMGDPGPQETM